MQLKVLLLFCLSAAIGLLTEHNSICAQNTELLKQISKSQVTEISNESRIILSPVEQTSVQYIYIRFKPPQHLQNRNKGINELCMKILADNIKNIPDSMAFGLKTISEPYAVRISYDSLAGTDSFLNQLQAVILSPNFSDLRKRNYQSDIIESNFPPKLPPYEVLKRKNASVFYGSKHPLGEPWSKEGINEINAADCENYYNNYLKNAEKDILVLYKPQDTLLHRAIRSLYNDSASQIPANVFPAPQIPEHSLLYFYESPQELISSDTYLNLIYTKSGFKLDKKNYALYQFINYSLSAHKVGLLDYSLTDTSETALYSFSEMRINEDILEHNMGLILKPENLEKALSNITKLMQSLRKEKLTPERLQTLKTGYLKKFESEIKSPKNLIILQKDMARYRLPADYFSDYQRKIQQISAADLQNFASRHLQSDKYTVTVFGKEKLLNNQLLFSSSQAEIKQYIDSENDFKITPYKFSAEDVIRRFLIKTRANEKSSSEFISVKSRYEFEQEIIETTTHIYRKKNKFLQKKFNRSDSLNKQPFDTKLFIKNRAFRKTEENYSELKGKDSLMLAELKQSYPEQNYLNNKTCLKLTGTDTVNQTLCYVVEIDKPQMLPRISYYSVSDSLKLKTESLKDSSLFSTLYFGAYIPAGSKSKRLIPAKQNLKMRDYSVISELDSVNFDIKLKNNLFKVD